MNINQNYGTVDIPSEIYDSFEQSHQQSERLSSSSKSSFPDKNNQSINLDSSIEESFLDNFNNFHTQNEKGKQNEEAEVSLSKNEIKANLLPGESFLQSIQIVNPTSRTIIVSFESELQISSGIHKSIKELEILPWERTEFAVKIQRKQDEYGDIYETIMIQSMFKSTQNQPASSKKHKTYLKVEVHFVTPKLKVRYSGCSDVVNIRGNKVSMNRVAKNKQGQYCLDVSLTGMERFQCKVQSYGDMGLIPKGLTLYNDELRKITLRKGERSNGVVVLRVINAKVLFALGVQFI